MKFTTIYFLMVLPVAMQSQVDVGVRSGIAFSKQKYDNFCHSPCTSNHILGMETGIMLNWFFLPSFFLQPELSFVQKGGTHIGHKKNTNKVNQLEMAALFGYSWKNEQLYVFVNTGLFLDRILNIVKYEGGPLSPYQLEEVEDNNWGWGLAHGGGAAIQVGKGWLELAGRFRHSQIESRHIYEFSINGERSQDPVLNYKNRGWSISLAYKIGIR